MSVFQYVLYSEFLADAYLKRHESDPAFSYEYIAKACGFRSRTVARNLIRGAERPTLAQLRALAKVFELADDETSYLLALYKFRETKDQATAFALFQELMGHQALRPNRTNPFRELEAATSILHLTILSMVDLPGFDPDPRWIGATLNMPHTPQEIERAVNDLKALQHLVQDSETGRWRCGQEYLKKFDDKPNFFLRKFHRECLELSRHALDNLPLEDRYLIGASFTISAKSFPRIVQKINAFVENLMRIEALSNDRDATVQVSAQIVRTASVAKRPAQPVLGEDFPESPPASEKQPPELPL